MYIVCHVVKFPVIFLNPKSINHPRVVGRLVFGRIIVQGSVYAVVYLTNEDLTHFVLEVVVSRADVAMSNLYPGHLNRIS